MLKKLVILLNFILMICFCFACKTENFPQPVLPDDEIQIPSGYTEESGLKMFDASSKDGIYNYCPSVIQEGDVRHVYYCTNKKPRNITDYIGYRKAVKIKDKWYYSPETLVLEPTKQAWDSRHTCDPDVIKGKFNYKGEQYNYLMAYLGCLTSNNQDNEVGLAIAKSPEGPWIKPQKINPICDWERNLDIDSNIFQWGYGQPSLVSVDKAGEVLLFYTAGTHLGTYTIVERINLSNIENPVKDKTFTDNFSKYGIKLGTKGLIDNAGNQDVLNNADFIYDSVRNRIYAVGDSHPSVDADDNDSPNFIASKSKIIYYNEADVNSVGFKIGNTFKNQKSPKRWTKICEIDKSISKKPRNHNATFVADAYGHMLKSDYIEVAFSISDVKKPNNSLWTYRLFRYEFKMSKDFL